MVPFRAALLASSFLLAAGAAHADAPSVAVSIKPIHSLVSAVMQGVGEPTLIVQATGSEHSYALRPSDAEALQGADVVFWIGHEMETFLEKPIESLASSAKVVELAGTAGLTLLPFREGGPFEAHEHAGAEHDHGHDHGTEKAAGAGSHDHDHGHDHDHSHDDDHGGGHAAEAGHGDGHAHGAHDMHFWLDPDNAAVLVSAIAETLAEADPDHADDYRRNADTYRETLATLSGEIEAQLAPVKDRPFVVFHDAYQYFERRFGVVAAGSITVTPDIAPGVQRLSAIQAKVRELGATCVFSEPQFEPRLVSVVTEGTQARNGVLDPLGADIEDGPDLYPALIRNMATSISTCLADPS
jgi:zinc transport system substrate-binding protein